MTEQRPELANPRETYGSFGALSIWALLLLAVVMPLIYGLPVTTVFSGADANFGMHQVQAYTLALRSGHWLPRWNPAGNSGFGAPVFYYYGRLPFLAAGVVSILLHVGPVGGLLWTIGLFRLLAFFTCRAWLREHVGRRSADLGALTFVAMPFAMLYNPLIRVGFAEIAATSFVPLLFLLMDREALGPARRVAGLAIVYAALAVSHLPQLVLCFAVLCLYAVLVRGARGLAANLAGLALGLLASADSALPALILQKLITANAWVNDRYVDIRNNFFFTPARLHLMHTLIGELLLYASWLSCFGIGVALLRRARGARRARAVAITLVLTLLAMTPVFWLAWVDIALLRELQFPWRLMPAATALASAGAALLAARTHRAQRLLLGMLTLLIVAQVADATGGAVIYLSAFGRAHHVPASIGWRVPEYVPWRDRDVPPSSTIRSFPPEYIPAAAHAAGWHIGAEDRVTRGPGQPSLPPAPPAGLVEARTADGTLTLRGTLAAPTTLLLPLFYFPDEQAQGSLRAAVRPDAATGLAAVSLPAGAVALAVTHTHTLPAVAEGRACSAVGCAVLLALLLLPVAAESRRLQSRTYTGRAAASDLFIYAAPASRPAAADAAVQSLSPAGRPGPAATPAHPDSGRPGR